MQKEKRAGDFAEKLVISFLEKNSFVCEKSEGIFYDYDIKAVKSDRVLTFEVKYDIMSERTGNIAIEYENCLKNEPSGIEATKADFWCYVLKNGSEYFLNFIAVESLKKFIEEVEPWKDMKYVGDSNASIKLYKKATILPYFMKEKQFESQLLSSV